MVVGTLKLCPFSEYETLLDEMQPYQLGLLMENHMEKNKEHYEMISFAFQLGYYKAKTGKKINMFEKSKKAKVGTITKEQKAQDFKYLDEVFKT